MVLSRKQLFILIILLIISPIFGVWLANILGYTEPLDRVAEELNLSEWEGFNWTPFKDYTVPGLPDWLGYIISGAIGIAIIIGIGYVIRFFIGRR
ncbi:cobalamin biosynthesis protein [Ignisphaera aggregans DSM 17230]|uniref:Cobalamin biosynthesis protein n=1 Tax=Ignisphaera aggregans (strain DSM 17230 / JCM 13409 / AQ1.S1) TaxID=583356 RepID=E0SQI1_IGNAA|nr:cobalamin biosynthesis protein [Ignisphaera aggregans DSM 17230]